MDASELLDGPVPDGHGTVDLAAARRVTYVLDTEVRYEYSAPIRALHHRLVVVPRARHADQRRVAHRVHVGGPARAAVRRRHDRFGNDVVDIEAPEVSEQLTCELRAVLSRSRDEARQRPWRPEHSRPTALTAADEELRDAAASITRRAPDRDVATAIGEAVRSAFRYEFGPTHVRTTAAEAWRLGRGVCQDMAHVMIAMCRARGLRARYVSGHLLGDGGSHAWVEVLDGSSGSTLAYDPTHARPTDFRYLTVAVGRDYLDVAPTSGSYRSGPRGRLSVRKRVTIADVA